MGKPEKGPGHSSYPVWLCRVSLDHCLPFGIWMHVASIVLQSSSVPDSVNSDVWPPVVSFPGRGIFPILLGLQTGQFEPKFFFLRNLLKSARSNETYSPVPKFFYSYRAKSK